MRVSFNYTDCIHVISNMLASEARKIGLKNLIIIPNGVDKEMIRYDINSLKKN